MITLISPPGVKTFSGFQMHVPNPPLGLSYIAAAVKAAGLPYRVIDATGEALERIAPYPERDDFMIQGLTFAQIVERVPSETRIIGLTCTFSTLWPLVKSLAEALRAAFPDALFVLGGEHGTAVAEDVLRGSAFDVVVLGEGEETVVALARAHLGGTSLRGVRGLALLEDGEVVYTGAADRIRDVDGIPLPDWDSFPIEKYIDGRQVNAANLGRTIPLLATRGCPFECTFCSNPGMWTRRWIPRDPKRVADEIELYMRKYRVTNFDFQDLTAIVKRRWVVDFCGELIRRGLNITWQMPIGTRAEVFDEEVADLLYRSGCRALAFAPESGSTDMLEAVKKRVDLERLEKAMRIAVRRGLKLSCFLVIGFPDETEETLRRTLRLVRRMAVLGVYDVSVAKFMPYPGSELFRGLQREGKIRLDDEFFRSPMDFYTDRSPSYAAAVSSPRLYQWMLRLFLNFYIISFALRPLRTTRILLVALVTGREETRYAKWFIDRVRVRGCWRALAEKSRCDIS